MYLRWAERHRFATENPRQTEGEETGIKRRHRRDRRPGGVRLPQGRNAASIGSSESAPPIRRSRRHTTFALAEVLPEVESDIEVELNWDEIRMDTFRATGSGRPARQQDRLRGPS